MSSEPLRYFDRYKRTLETERIYGEKWMRLVYGNPVGQLLLWLVVRRAIFSRWYGWKMKKPVSALRIIPFIAEYNLDVDEFVKSAFDYKSFNEFFCRELKASARPIAEGGELAVFPADGRHLAFPDIDMASGYYVKGAKFSLSEFLGEDRLPEEERVLTKKFTGGALLISRLCPIDYHRFHFAVDGVPAEPRPISGWLYSVSPLALRQNIRYLVENKREITMIDSPVFGSVAMVEVGATNVGSIIQAFVPGRTVVKGVEKGMFSFGGSCVVTLFQRGRIVFDPDIVEQSSRCIETYAKMGDRLGGSP